MNTDEISESTNYNNNNNMIVSSVGGGSSEMILQSLLLDLMMPMTTPAAASSQFDLNSTASNENNQNAAANIDSITLIYQQQQQNVANFAAEFNTTVANPATLTQQVLLTSGGISNKQINDQIMRTCMGYLDYINKKHNKERHIQKVK